MVPISDKRRLLPPDHRSLGVRYLLDNDQKVPTDDKLCLEYSWFLHNKYDSVSDAVYDACLLDSIPYARMALRAFLFAGAPLSAIVSATEVSEAAILAYSHLFFDNGVFRNRLIRMAYVRALNPATPQEEEMKKMFMWGLQLGWEYLSWQITGGQTSLSTTDVMRKLMTDSLWRSREHMFNSITDGRSKEARAWVPLAIKLAEQVTKADPDKVNSLEELKIRLEGLDVTVARTKLGENDIFS